VIAAAYPAKATERTRWILAQRGARNEVQMDRPYAFFHEQERTEEGAIADVAAIFLTNRECPWKCVMCDLWRNTTVAPMSAGAIARQINHALERLPAASILKLYNSGSFFDAGAIPRSEWKSIAALCAGFRHVIVECHPRLIDQGALEFTSLLSGGFEIALGLETCHQKALEALNKRFNLFHYQAAAAFLRENGIAVRTFLLVHPPFIERRERQLWLRQSLRFSFDAGSNVVSLIPIRLGNGALDHLKVEEPALHELEEALEWGLELNAGRVFADTWDLGRFGRCAHCVDARTRRIVRINLSQRTETRVACAACGT
jgi:radical SAM enzyme (TIGR01210 family)